MDIINKSGDEDFSSLYIRYYPNGYIGALMKENPEIKEENEGIFESDLAQLIAS